uniref:Uncharacterized protein n=1 Tax=Fagus sylvatica TaxID=28930 RepID=A0A2N9GQY3_FAGSY
MASLIPVDFCKRYLAKSSGFGSGFQGSWIANSSCGRGLRDSSGKSVETPRPRILQDKYGLLSGFPIESGGSGLFSSGCCGVRKGCHEAEDDAL